ncbi:hypothetical protein llap_22937 [Limosa lapponica baueri]|uniref:Uncharacterized protein n=1 Tax=Limosa lapponica baueri TaxID=1758121 RepID=A0A2I0SZ01_LIMLA|nr:hypothetical protein llap_22937 [Limosa lapponica baueri]
MDEWGKEGGGGGAVQWPAAHGGEALQRVPGTAQAGETPGTAGNGGGHGEGAGRTSLLLLRGVPHALP